MSGLLARRGFRFQDLYLLRRILRDTADAVASKIASQGADTMLPLQFGIEAKTSATETPDWDSIISCSATNEVIEAKSGVIAKDDRLAMWRRLRREIIGSGDRQVRPVLVVDPTCESTEKWHTLAGEAADRLTRSRQQTVPEQPRAVRDVGDLLDEALSQLCGAEDEGQLVTQTVALKILATFTVESFSFADLETSVLAGIELLFPNGFSDQLSDAMLGWLGRRATDKAAPRRLFAARELLGEMGVLQQCAAFDSGILSRWKTRWNDLPALFEQRARTRLGKAGESVPMEQSQPAVVTTLDNRAANVVVLGPGGGGKTALLAQIGARAEAQGAEVFGCSADAISEDEVSDLFASLRFKRALLNVREPQRQMYVIVDALDEADPTLRTRWTKQLARFGVNSCGSVITSVRDHAWLNDGITRAQLTNWQPVAIQEWSEQLVRDLVRQRWPEADLSPGLLTLIGQPLMLDLFWRTFVEGGEARSARDALPETRHQLLSAFWTERILRAPRHQMPNLQQRLQTVLTRAAAAISDFDDHEIDVAALNVLLSESVIIPEGQLHQKYRFRHPLLRDFAMALWCLAAPNSALVAQRWSQIKGGLQRHGALRAILDALGDPLFTADHSHLSRTDVITAMLAAHAEAPMHVAEVLGTFAPETAFDPALWPESLQRHLPSNFASELVTAARLAGNFRWTNSVANWPLDAQWIDDSFTDALRDFVGAIRLRSPAESPTSYVLQLGRVVAAKLRQVSEHPRFRPLFESNARWRKMAAMNEVIPLLPDESTFEWVEREMPVASWRTRGFLFDKLIYLAATDPQRTASIYCTAVGLTKEDGFATIDPACWSDNLMEYQAIDWALAGKDQHRSLLKEFPEAFLPVAFDLAEALAGKDKHMRIATAADGLAEDYLDYSFWREGRDHSPVGRCIRAIKNASEHLADSNPTLFFHARRCSSVVLGY